MSEIRRDPVMGRWVIIAPDVASQSQVLDAPELSDDVFCPFCPGHEESTPAEILAYGPESREPNTPGWQLRCFPNSAPVLRAERSDTHRGMGMFDFIDGVGTHEVIVYTPEHSGHLGSIDEAHLVLLLRSFRARISDLFKDTRLRYVMIALDKGSGAGAFLPHPHCQIMGIPVTPGLIKEELQGSQRYYLFKERCVFCDMIREELHYRERVVAESGGHIALCPFASYHPYQLWVLPRQHQLDFTDQSDEDLESLAAILKSVVRRLDRMLDFPAYSLMLHTGPNRVPRSGYWETIDKDYHWHIEIVPRFSEILGFEGDLGFHINTVPPENAAEAYREHS